MDIDSFKKELEQAEKRITEKGLNPDEKLSIKPVMLLITLIYQALRELDQPPQVTEKVVHQLLDLSFRSIHSIQALSRQELDDFLEILLRFSGLLAYPKSVFEIFDRRDDPDPPKH